MIGSDRPGEWQAAAERAGAHDVYYRLAYHELYGYTGRRPLGYAYEDGGEALFHPFLLCPIERVGDRLVPERLVDISTVYGYTGPVATTDSPDFLREAWRGFDAWCREAGVVSEFIRFNPLLRAERFAAPDSKVQLNRATVLVRLDGGEAGLLAGYDPAHRKKVRKAARKGVVCREADLAEGLPAFVRIYEETMREQNAPPFYFFPPAYYEGLRSRLRDATRLFFADHGGRPVAAALMLAHGDTLYSHLSGSLAASKHLSANNLLFHEILVWGLARGYRRLHLGGGRTSRPEDPLLRFKRNFSNVLLPFHIGERVFDRERYDALCAAWIDQAAGERAPSALQPYRMPVG